MPHQSDLSLPGRSTRCAIKGFAKVDVLAELAGAARWRDVEQHLAGLRAEELGAVPRGPRPAGSSRPDGREAHAEALAEDVAAAPSSRDQLLGARTTAFLTLNEPFKELCGDWQLRDGAPNDHTDAALRRGGHRPAARRSTRRPSRWSPRFGGVWSGCAPYGPRLSTHAPSGWWPVTTSCSPA